MEIEEVDEFLLCTETIGDFHGLPPWPVLLDQSTSKSKQFDVDCGPVRTTIGNVGVDGAPIVKGVGSICPQTLLSQVIAASERSASGVDTTTEEGMG